MKAPYQKNTSKPAELQSSPQQQHGRADQQSAGFADNRPQALTQAAIQQMADTSPRGDEMAQLQVMAKGERPNRTGLPDGLKAGIENLSGYSMDDVKVHYNSDQPAQLQAHAYAQGTDIHLAQGQEKHLPHEAWHIVQQKQGRVKPTIQLKGGIDVNDDEGLEKEADVMGKKATGAFFGGHASDMLNTSLAPLANISAQRKVIQLLSTQIVLNEEHKIKHLVVRGRPPRTHGSRMGDHSTAFIVHVEGLNLALENLNINDAIERISELHAHIQDLLNNQGVEIPAIQIELNEFNEHIASARRAVRVSGGEDMAIHHLQLALSAYLRAREIVPFSTINVAAISEGLAGKGRGESRHAAVLSRAERDENDMIPNEELIAAVHGLFDSQASGLVAVENDSLKVESLVGQPTNMLETRGAINRLNIIFQQHLKSIAVMFPRCYRRIDDQLSVNRYEATLRKLDENSLDWGLSWAGNRLDSAERKLQELMLYFKTMPKIPQRKGTYVYERVKALAELYKMISAINNQVPNLDHISHRLNNDGYKAQLAELRMRIHNLRLSINKSLPSIDSDVKEEKETVLETTKGFVSKIKKSKAKADFKPLQNLHIVVQGPPPSPGGPSSYPSSPMYAPTDEPSSSEMDFEDLNESPLSVVSTPAEKDDQDASVEEDLLDAPEGTLAGSTASMSIQLILSDNNDKVQIKGMLSSGRPPSPFKGTMGAHSTAWIVHLDRVRKRLMGLTLPEAVVELQKLIVETKLSPDRLVPSTLGDNAVLQIGAATEAIEQWETGEIHARIDVVQRMINDILSYLNLLPGVSQQAINTNGNTEGMWRKILLDKEYRDIGTQDEVVKAIRQLYDQKGARRYENHWEYIRQAYPRAAAFARGDEVPSILDEEPISNRPDDTTIVDDAPLDMAEGVVEAMRSYYTQENYLDDNDEAGLNNCLFNAIADAAGVVRPTIDQVIRIREILNVPLGRMLAATQQNLDIILAVMGLDDRGAIVFYQGEEWLDTTTHIGDEPLFIRHDGHNHFTAATEMLDPVVSELEDSERKLIKVIDSPPKSFLKKGATLFEDGKTWIVVEFEQIDEVGTYRIVFQLLTSGMALAIK